MTVPPPHLTAAPFVGAEGVRHGYFGRRGGVSSGRYASLNCGPGSDDAPAAVTENRARVAAALAVRPEHLLSLHQVHGTDVVTVTEAWPARSRPRADAAVTDRPGFALGILAADCGPVLFADAQQGVIGACHAGWAGALAGVVEATVCAMEKLGARRERMVAALGPCIAQPSYEVGPEFRARFIAADAGNERFFAPAARAGHAMFDLPGYILARVTRLGLKAQGWIGRDTLAETEEFFSYRRVTLQGGGDYGRNISAVALAE